MEFRIGDNRFYQIDSEGKLIAEVTFVPSDNILIIDSTFVDPVYRGQKIGEQLVKKVVDKAEQEHKKIIPLCPFAKKEFERHEEYRHLQK